MKTLSLKTSYLSIAALLVGAGLFSISAVQAQTLTLQLKASDYVPATGTWTATVGSNATQATAANRPTLVTGVTPNSSSAVRFDGANDFFSLTTAIPAGTAYTAFAYLRVNDTATDKTIFGGDSGTFQYRISSAEKQNPLRQAQAQLGTSTTAVSTSAFSSINVTVSSTGGTFRLNGVGDGTTTGSSFSNTIKYIGYNTNSLSGGGEIFSGDLVELRIYTGVMTDLQRAAVENEFIAAYVTAVPEPSTYGMALAMFLGTLVLIRRRRQLQS